MFATVLDSEDEVAEPALLAEEVPAEEAMGQVQKEKGFLATYLQRATVKQEEQELRQQTETTTQTNKNKRPALRKKKQ